MKSHLILLACVIAAPCVALDLPSLHIPRAATPPPLDAALEAAPIWATAVVVPALTRSINRDHPDATPLPDTDIRMLWDSTALYLRFVCRDDQVYLPFDQHDEPLYQGDVVEVFLDPVGDAKQYVEIQVAANNAVFDQNLLITTEPQSDADGKLLPEICERNWWPLLSYDIPTFRSAATQHDQVWIVEMAIPAQHLARRLGVNAWAAGQELRLNLLRYEWSKPHADNKRTLLPMNWAPVIDGCPHISPQAMGRVTLLE